MCFLPGCCYVGVNLTLWYHWQDPLVEKRGGQWRVEEMLEQECAISAHDRQFCLWCSSSTFSAWDAQDRIIHLSSNWVTLKDKFQPGRLGGPSRTKKSQFVREILDTRPHTKNNQSREEWYSYSYKKSPEQRGGTPFLNMSSDLNFSLSRDFPKTSRFISGLRSSPPDWNGSNLGGDLDHENHEHIVNSN